MRRVQRASSVADGSVADGSVAETRVESSVRLIAQSYNRRSVPPRVPSSGTRERNLKRKESERPRPIPCLRITQRVRGQALLQPPPLPSPDCHTVLANRWDRRSLTCASGMGAGPVPASGCPRWRCSGVSGQRLGPNEPARYHVRRLHSGHLESTADAVTGGPLWKHPRGPWTAHRRNATESPSCTARFPLAIGAPVEGR